jgi:hypothetical protein
MNSLALPETNLLYVVIGGANAAGHLLALAARLALRGPLLILDCGNRANPLPLARELYRLTDDPVAALGNLGARSARAFNCYQVATLIGNTANHPVQCPVLIFDLLATFYDESISYREGSRLLEQSLGHITRMRHSVPLVVSAKPPPADFPERKAFLDLLCRAADQIWIDENPPAQLPQQLSFPFGE